MIENFKPALLFLGKFLAVYFIGNIIYGLYIESCNDVADAFTRSATHQTALVLKTLGANVRTENNPQAPTVFIKNEYKTVLNIFEGCNGVNVMIVFVAFLIAFGGPKKAMFWFIPAGLFAIHVANLGRLVLLYFVTLHYEQYFYFVHKYFFTAILYLIVFTLWIIWVLLLNKKRIAGE